jgi:hypothetical protein
MLTPIGKITRLSLGMQRSSKLATLKNKGGRRVGPMAWPGGQGRGHGLVGRAEGMAWWVGSGQ